MGLGKEMDNSETLFERTRDEKKHPFKARENEFELDNLHEFLCNKSNPTVTDLKGLIIFFLLSVEF